MVSFPRFRAGYFFEPFKFAFCVHCYCFFLLILLMTSYSLLFYIFHYFFSKQAGWLYNKIPLVSIILPALDVPIVFRQPVLVSLCPINLVPLFSLLIFFSDHVPSFFSFSLPSGRPVFSVYAQEGLACCPLQLDEDCVDPSNNSLLINDKLLSLMNLICLVDNFSILTGRNSCSSSRTATILSPNLVVTLFKYTILYILPMSIGSGGFFKF